MNTRIPFTAYVLFMTFAAVSLAGCGNKEEATSAGPRPKNMAVMPAGGNGIKTRSGGAPGKVQERTAAPVGATNPASAP